MREMRLERSKGWLHPLQTKQEPREEPGVRMAVAGGRRGRGDCGLMGTVTALQDKRMPELGL